MADDTLSPKDRKRIASKLRMRQLRAADPEKFKVRQREWYAANRERANRQSYESRKRRKAADPVAWNKKIAAKSRRQYAANPRKHLDRQKQQRLANLAQRRLYEREWRFKRDYGLTIAQRDQMLAAQGGCCAVCRSSSPGNKKGWHVDHCHSTGKVRSILCHHCNNALGQAKDSPERLRALALYVEIHRTE